MPTTLQLARETLNGQGIPPLVSESMINGLIQLQGACHNMARKAGWWKPFDEMPVEYRKYFLGCHRDLIHSELGEATEGARKNKMDDHLPERKNEEVELADAVIRIMDYAGACGYNLGAAIIEKMAVNATRADHKEENRAAEGGKAF